MSATRTGAVLFSLVSATVICGANQHAPSLAVPIEPIGAILDSFRSHSIVALSDAHGNEQAHAFLLSLIRDPRFAATVNDIVVEFGNSRYQDLIDRFVGGEDVPYDLLRLAWQDTTQASAANDRPINEAFFRAVRAVNSSLPGDRRLRVLLGDPPIDWDKVHTKEDHFRWIEMRESYPAALVQLEVLAKQRRALLVYGHGHLQRQNIASNYVMDDWRAQTIVSLLEKAGPTRVFTIWRTEGLTDIQADVAQWRYPSLATIRGTSLGAADAQRYFAQRTRFAVREGKLVAIGSDEWRILRAEEQFDALLYLGPSSAMTESQWAPSLCADSTYMEMRLRRIALSGIPQAEADRLKQHCASVASR